MCVCANLLVNLCPVYLSVYVISNQSTSKNSDICCIKHTEIGC